MTASFKSLWKVPAYLPYLQPTLTSELIAEAEEKLGVKLPSTYLALLREQNGGYVRRTLPDTVHSMIWGIGPHFPNILEFHYALDPEQAELGAWLPSEVQQLIPFDGDGHWYLCFDYRSKAGEPGIAYIDLEAEMDARVSDTFEEFLGQLQFTRPEGFWGIKGISLDEAAAAIGTALKLTFEPAQDNDHGYPIRRCRLTAGRMPEWVWLSPNTAPRGFVRPSDKRYQEVKDSLPGTSLRFPEFPDAHILVQTTEGAADTVRMACVAAGLALVQLGA